MITETWRVVLTRTDLPTTTSPPPFELDQREQRVDWMRRERLIDGVPYLLSPAFQNDVELNEFFRSTEMTQRAPLTKQGYARDLAAFLSFLWAARDRRSWRDATEADHLAYLSWRRQDPAGPRVSGGTWNREVAAVNQFYRWALRLGHGQVHPIPQASRRPLPAGVGWARRRTLDEQRPATYASDGGRDRVQWLPPAAYRTWREVGVRGYSPDGLPRPTFRGRWAARNSAFCDLMIRTGLRLQEQAALTVFDLPDRGTGAGGGYRRFWLPEAVAKGSSARWVCIPARVLADLHAYAQLDRAAVVAEAQADGRYRRLRHPLVVTEHGRRAATQPGTGRTVDLARLGPGERLRLLVEGPGGLEPAALWLGEYGWPITTSRWKNVFAEANGRCASAQIALRCHPHMLRHSFAVITLEQLQRGHLAALGELTAQQRTHYTRIFGDPLDWVRRRLGHRSVVTTQIYLHALAELEMDTRTALVPDDWEIPHDPTAPGEAPAEGTGR
ncbi:site-specific integrase [Amycolatopsis sp. NPDC004625]|uniref:tyrosine-type recombinase/integrase n=1 Tax=Amycolatopsis sp. NPDC004625 TaxID=3154670 RepID=UPI0033B4802C